MVKEVLLTNMLVFFSYCTLPLICVDCVVCPSCFRVLGRETVTATVTATCLDTSVFGCRG